VDPGARRLIVAAAVRLHVARRLGPGTPREDLVDTAHRLRMPDDHLRCTYGLTFEPDYPGVTAGPQAVRGGHRLVLGCLARHHDEPAATVITTLILGRPPQITAAPADTGPPPTWTRPWRSRPNDRPVP
jgi:hypothetical protein